MGYTKGEPNSKKDIRLYTIKNRFNRLLMSLGLFDVNKRKLICFRVYCLNGREKSKSVCSYHEKEINAY